MIRTSGIVTYYLSMLPRYEDGRTIDGLVQVTLDEHPLPPDDVHPEARHVYESEPGLTVDQLPGVPASVDVIGMPWTPAAMAALFPVQAPYCLNSEWEEEVTDETGTYVARRRDREILVPQGVTPLRTGIPSHIWAQDK